MSLRKSVRVLYEAHMKEICDKNAREDYVNAEGKTEGITQYRNEGLAEGKTEDILLLLSEKETVPEDLERRIRNQKNPDVLSSWLLKDAAAGSLEEFMEKTEI